MPEELETILRLVAEGTLTPEEAAPIIDALATADRSRHAATFAKDRIHRHLDSVDARIDDAFARSEGQAARPAGGPRLRIRVTEHGRQVVNLRIPIGFVDAALRFVPGLGGDQADRIREAVSAGAIGPIIDVEDSDGEGGVLISVE